MRRYLCLLLLWVSAAAGAQEYDLVLAGGRVMDPETSLDAIRYVGITGGTVAAISDAPIQDPISNRLQAADGVTTALEMELGVYPVGDWRRGRQGEAVIHSGATV